jgi:hypothetical protein
MAQSVAQTYRREGTLSEGNKKRIRSQESKKQLRAKQMRRRASHPAPHCSWIIQVAFPPLRAARQRYQSDSARKRVPHLPVLAACQAVRRIAVHATFAAASGPTRSKNRKWRRPQCPGNRYALARVFQFPLAIHPRELPVCHQRHRKSSFDRLESSNVFAEPTLRQDVVERNIKPLHSCAEAVEDDSCLWKTEENSGENPAGQMQGEERG